mmetsp:Transcript_91160/g.253964  ORF Transcript_91160/g.253964 Transcript_91160/m.253964 type:complete len:377 (-) Transcript_91160:321-1451(-)
MPAAQRVRAGQGLHDRGLERPGHAGHLGGVPRGVCLRQCVRPRRRPGRAPHDLHAGGRGADLLPVSALAVPAAAPAGLDPGGAHALLRPRRHGALQRPAHGSPGRAPHERRAGGGALGRDVQRQQLAALRRVPDREPGLLFLAEPLRRDAAGPAEQAPIAARGLALFLVRLREAGPGLVPLRRAYLLPRRRAAGDEGPRVLHRHGALARGPLVGGLAARLPSRVARACHRRPDLGRQPPRGLLHVLRLHGEPRQPVLRALLRPLPGLRAALQRAPAAGLGVLDARRGLLRGQELRPLRRRLRQERHRGRRRGLRGQDGQRSLDTGGGAALRRRWLDGAHRLRRPHGDAEGRHAAGDAAAVVHACARIRTARGQRPA